MAILNTAINKVKDIWRNLTQPKFTPVKAPPPVTDLQQYLRPTTTTKPPSTTIPYNPGYGGGGYSSYSQPAYELPDTNQVVDELAEKTADLVESINKDMKEISDMMGGLNFDENVLREKAIELVTPYMEEEAAYLQKQLAEGRIQTREDYDMAINAATTKASQLARQLDLRQAKTDEELQNTLTEIGARTDMNLTEARANLKNIVTSTEKSLLKSGLGFSGTAKETLGDVRSLGAARESDVLRQGEFAKNQAQTSAAYALRDVADARLAIAENRTLEQQQQDTLKARRERYYGTGEEDQGLYGARESQLLARSKEEKIQSEVENLKAQKRQEVQSAINPKSYELQTKLSTLSGLRGGGSYI